MFFQKQQIFKTQLFNEENFYKNFLKDLMNSRGEVIIESPYITSSRMELLMPIFQALLEKGIKIHILTRNPVEHEDEYMKHQSTNEILKCTELGINIVLLKGNHHRKLAVIDRQILWEGSLNILSFSNSLEIMRRIESEDFAIQMFKFLQLGRLL